MNHNTNSQNDVVMNIIALGATAALAYGCLKLVVHNYLVPEEERVNIKNLIKKMKK